MTDTRIVAAERAAKKASAKLDQIIAEVQTSCPHKTLYECDYRPSRITDGYASPPMRVCEDCGMSEDGWGSGYFALKGKAYSCSRDELYALRYGLHIGDHHKGPLLRRETTVAEMIAASLEDQG